MIKIKQSCQATCAELEEGPRQLELLDLLKKEPHHDILLSLLQGLLPFDEEVLEGEVAFLPESEPLFLLEFLQLLPEVVEESPGGLSLVQLVLHQLIILELRCRLAKMLRVDVELFNFPFQLSLLLLHVLHDFGDLHRLLVGELIPLLWFLLLPPVVHLFELNSEALGSFVDLFPQSLLLVLYFVVEGP